MPPLTPGAFDPINLALAFIEGVALIASPCILPILPIVLSVGLDGGKGRPYGVILGFISAFCAFTLLSRSLVNALGLDPILVRNLAYGLLLALGFVMLSTRLTERFSDWTQQLSNLGNRLSKPGQQKQGFGSGFLLGLFIGLVWSPCVGPIIAAVLVQTIRQQSDINSLLTLTAFSVGVGLPMLLITLGGKRVMTQLNFFKTRSTIIRKSLGAVIIATVLLTVGGDLWRFAAPDGSNTNELNGASAAVPGLKAGLPQPYIAPDFTGIQAWLNTPGNKPLSMASLKGKVVLVDFWTYSCINCIRTLPYITTWDKRYRDQGLVIVGVHSPEFEFEKDLGNVRKAVSRYHIQYPVALDNRLDTFTGFGNQYWPAHYLIDRTGKVVYTHFGEGEYDRTEQNIRTLLGLKGGGGSIQGERAIGSANQTPETYLGYARAESFASPEAVGRNRSSHYSLPANLPKNAWALQGNWNMGSEKIVSKDSHGTLRLHFSAKKVFLVLGTESGKPVTLNVALNGKPVVAKDKGKDVSQAALQVSSHRLYELVNQAGGSKSGTLELRNVPSGLSAYAFTFGG
jgi:cytochrome c biogenesis protein CcdA/thiol-disulfide isomerase/thioredoxin